ncbi:MAG: hypothetical protein R6U55_14850 [Desulfovermiculus sp.]
MPGPERREKASFPATERAGRVEYLLPISPDPLVDAEAGFPKSGPRLWAGGQLWKSYSYSSYIPPLHLQMETAHFPLSLPGNPAKRLAFMNKDKDWNPILPSFLMVQSFALAFHGRLNWVSIFL